MARPHDGGDGGEVRDHRADGSPRNERNVSKGHASARSVPVDDDMVARVALSQSALPVGPSRMTMNAGHPAHSPWSHRPRAEITELAAANQS